MTTSPVTSGVGPPVPGRPSLASRFIGACLYCAKPARRRRTATIALVVGTILTLLNQGDVILAGHATSATAIKAALTYAVPFVVSNVGMLSGRGTADADDEQMPLRR